MYDHLYEVLDRFDVEVVVHEDHPTLNRHVAALLATGERLDLISTHAKYAPSQSQWLHPLDDLVNPDVIDALAPRAVSLCRYRGALLCLPRLIDVRILWARHDRIDSVPDTWVELDHSRVVFGFPGRESGLFGTFFELVDGAGGRLFDAEDHPCIESDEALAAVEMLIRLASRVPADLVHWHYDDVDAALLDGRLDAAAAWPGAWGSISRSKNAHLLSPHPYPAGARRRVTYSGCHAWAIPRTTGDLDGAVELLQHLLGFAAQSLDAQGGNICAHAAALESVIPVSEVDRRRLDITRTTIAQSMITYPQLDRFPEIEDAGWSAIQQALQGRIGPAAALALIQRKAEALATSDTPKQEANT